MFPGVTIHIIDMGARRKITGNLSSPAASTPQDDPTPSTPEEPTPEPTPEYVSSAWMLEVWDNIQNFELAATITEGITISFDDAYNYDYVGTLTGSVAGANITAEFYQAPDAGTLNSPANAVGGVGATANLDMTVSDPNSDLLDVIVYGGTVNQGDDFRVLVVPDIQKYYASGQAYLVSMFDWIVAEAGTGTPPVGMVLSEGDQTDTNAPEEWAFVQGQWNRLKGLVPWTVITGNHDKVAGLAPELKAYFPAAFFGTEAYWGDNYIHPTEGEQMDGNYQLLTLGGIDWLFMNLGDLPHAGLVEWANAAISTYPNRKVIFTTHGFLWDTGIFYPDYSAKLWEPLVKVHNNIIMLLCGHRHDQKYRHETWGTIAAVDVMMANWQNDPHGGNSWLRELTFSPKNNRVDVKSYAPYYGVYDTNGTQQFSLDVPLSTQITEIARYEGVSTGTNIVHPWTGLDAGGTYAWYVRTLDASGRATDSPIHHFVS